LFSGNCVCKEISTGTSPARLSFVSHQIINNHDIIKENQDEISPTWQRKKTGYNVTAQITPSTHSRKNMIHSIFKNLKGVKNGKQGKRAA
jgi:hypothetical protein